MLQKSGAVLKVLNLITPEKSTPYNPFVYLKTDNDVQRLATNLFKNTTPRDVKTSDPFWDNAAMMLLLALMFYLHYEAIEEEQNFPMVVEMIRYGDVKEDNSSYMSSLDMLFADLEKRDPYHIAVKYYRNYRSGADKTLKSIQISLLTRLEKFNLDSLSSITKTDDMELDKIGERKTVVFAVIPDNDSSFNFMIGMLYTQMFQQLYYQADVVHKGRLPYHVHFIMDEFANVPQPDSFPMILSTMRSRGISVSIIIQNMAQLKALYEKEWENIAGNCDEFLYLGGNELSTHEYVAKMLGKETIDIQGSSKGSGAHGTYTTTRNRTGRELMTADEVRKLDNGNALLFIRGEKPVIDRKYDLMKHPDINMSEDGGAEPFNFDVSAGNYAVISFDAALMDADITETDDDISSFVIISDEDVKERLDSEGYTITDNRIKKDNKEDSSKEPGFPLPGRKGKDSETNSKHNKEIPEYIYEHLRLSQNKDSSGGGGHNSSSDDRSIGSR